MADNETFHLPIDTSTQHAEPAGIKQSQRLLGPEASPADIIRELAVIEAIERGRKDAEAGLVVGMEEAFRQFDEVIEAARSRR